MPNTNADFGYGVNVTTCHSHFVCPEVSKSVISPAGLFFRATSRLLPSTLKALILVFPCYVSRSRVGAWRMHRTSIPRNSKLICRCAVSKGVKCPAPGGRAHRRGCSGIVHGVLTPKKILPLTPEEHPTPRARHQRAHAKTGAHQEVKGTAIRVVWQVSAVSVHVTVDSRVPTKAVASLAQAL